MKKSLLNSIGKISDIVHTFVDFIDIRGAYVDWVRDKPFWMKIGPGEVTLILALLLCFLQ